MQIISGGKTFCWKIATSPYNHGWKSKRTQMYYKPSLSLGCLSFCGVLIYGHGSLNGKRWSKNMCGEFLCLVLQKHLSSPLPKTQLFIPIPGSSPPHPHFTLLPFPPALFPLYHVSRSESVDPQLFKKQLKLPTYKHRFLCLLNLF